MTASWCSTRRRPGQDSRATAAMGQGGTMPDVAVIEKAALISGIADRSTIAWDFQVAIDGRAFVVAAATSHGSVIRILVFNQNGLLK
jgi:hypothetical protein